MKLAVRVVLAWALLNWALPGGAVFAARAHHRPAGQGPGWVLSATSLGPLKLYKGATVSEAMLKKLFRGYKVTYDIEQGDSPDFHYFEVVGHDGQPLFGIRSFIDEGRPQHKTTEPVPIDSVEVYSPLIPDSWGLRVGDPVRDILARRGKKLAFGAGHHDVTVGSNMIYYSLATDGDTDPSQYTLKDAVRHNWRIAFISWPDAAWE